MSSLVVVNKACVVCAAVKPLADFYRNATGADGHRTDCKDCTKARQRGWNAANTAHVHAYNVQRYADPEGHARLLAASNAYRAEHLEERRAYDRARGATPERKTAGRASGARRADHRAAYGRERYAADPERFRAFQAIWRRGNRDKIILYGKRRRGRKAAARSLPVRRADRVARVYLYGLACTYCGKTCRTDVPSGHPDRPTEDHAIPLVRGGRDCLANLRLACKSCNSRKHTKTPAEFLPERFR